MDESPFTIYEAAQGAQITVDEINKVTGSNYILSEVLRLDGEAIKANKEMDLTSAKIARDIKSGAGKYVEERVYYSDHSIEDDEDNALITGRGAIVFIFLTWVDDKLPKAKEIMEKYCRLISMRGYGGGASKLLDKVLEMNKDEGAA